MFGLYFYKSVNISLFLLLFYFYLFWPVQLLKRSFLHSFSGHLTSIFPENFWISWLFLISFFLGICCIFSNCLTNYLQIFWISGKFPVFPKLFESQNITGLIEPPLPNPFWVFWLRRLAVCCPTIVESVGSQLANFTPPPPPARLFTLSPAPAHEKNEAELASRTVMALI